MRPSLRTNLLLVLLAWGGAAQNASAPKQREPSQQEKREAADLEFRMAEAGNSPIDMIHGLEDFLASHPKTKRRVEIENALLRASIDAQDRGRIIRYGDLAILRTEHDGRTMSQLVPLLLERSRKGDAELALRYARRLESIAQDLPEPSDPHRRAQWIGETGRLRARALVWQAQAHRLIGRPAEALCLAEEACSLDTTASCQREIARAAQALNKDEEAIEAYALSFALALKEGDFPTAQQDRRAAQALAGASPALSEKLIEGLNRAENLDRERLARLRQADPNAELSDPFEFRLSSPTGDPLDLGKLRGKVVVMDFWATWCAPCRAQHPLYERLRERYSGNPHVAILSINNDHDRAQVLPFLEQQGWRQPVWFEDGLARLLKVTSIPTTLIYDTQGKLYSRITGFPGEPFFDMMVRRIEVALKERAGAESPAPSPAGQPPQHAVQ